MLDFTNWTIEHSKKQLETWHHLMSQSIGLILEHGTFRRLKWMGFVGQGNPTWLNWSEAKYAQQLCPWEKWYRPSSAGSTTQGKTQRQSLEKGFCNAKVHDILFESHCANKRKACATYVKPRKVWHKIQSIQIISTSSRRAPLISIVLCYYWITKIMRMFTFH